MKNTKMVCGVRIAGIAAISMCSLTHTFESWFQKNISQPFEKNVIQPAQKGFDTHIAKPFEKDVIQPIQKGFETHIVKPFERDVIQPVNENLVKPVAGIVNTIGHVVNTVNIIARMITPIEQHVLAVIDHVEKLAKTAQGSDLVDPLFNIVDELIHLPSYFQALLDQVTQAMLPISDIVRPSDAAAADVITKTRATMVQINKDIYTMVSKINELSKRLRIRMRSIAKDVDQSIVDVQRVVESAR